MVVKNEKGEATSQEVTILDLPDPEPEKGEKPQIVKGLVDVVCIFSYLVMPERTIF